MVLERKVGVSITDLQGQYNDIAENRLRGLESEDVRNTLIGLMGFMQMYNGAMKEISTKLEVLDDEFQIRRRHNPIHHMECRIKSPRSIAEKMQRRGLQLSMGAVQEHIQDIAGIRVICNFLNDIYVVEQLLLKQVDVTLVRRKDYIVQPKANGYRSLHLVVKVPVFLSDKTEEIPVEIQLRTMAMDYWASLEHKLRYKNGGSDMREYAAMLLDCANTLAETERTMQYIRERVDE